MPVRSRFTLLAGVAAVLALTAGAGCQSSSGYHESHSSASCTSCGAGGITSYDGVGVSSTQASTSGRIRPLFVRRPTTQEPPQAQAPTCQTCQAAVMLRPVPSGTLSGQTASSWSPVQRLGDAGTGSASGGINQASALEPVRVAPPVAPAVSAPIVSVPPVTSGGLSIDVPLAPAPETKAAPQSYPIVSPPKRTTTLPPPREVARNDKNDKKEKVASGYPELPPVAITNPPAAPREFCKRALSSYIIEPPDVLAIEGIGKLGDPSLPITGPHLVRPDGTVGLGTYGSVFVAGLTIDQAKDALAALILSRQEKLTIQQIREGLKVDVAAYNSKFYYIIADGGGYGETVVRIPCTGNELVLDALSQIQGLPAVASKKLIWVARAMPDEHGHSHPYILPVDWCGITQRGSAATNYQIYPGDRIYVNSDPLIRTDSRLAKVLAPIERLLGVTLLTSSVINSIKNGGSGGSGGSGTGTNTR
jgi:polysaccharide export outer membrane protein